MNIPGQTHLLNGVRVLDLCQYIPGPYASMQLAQLGAQVIKVEAPGGDPMRKFGAAKDEISSFYQHLNRGKKIVELNLKRDSEKGIFAELVSGANILLEGFRPGTLSRMGYPPTLLAEINPALIICSLSGFGQNGPQAHRAGHDLGYSAYAGLYSMQSAKPSIIFPPVSDHVGALQALSVILAALYQQEKTGQGCYLDMSLVEPVLAWQYLSETSADNSLISGGAAYYNIYQTADNRFLSLAALEPKFWSAFCNAVNKPQWLDRQTDAMPQTRLTDELGSLFSSQKLCYWQAILEGVDCCFEHVPLQGDAGLTAQSRAQSMKNRFPGKINGMVTPDPVEFETFKAAEINWTNE